MSLINWLFCCRNMYITQRNTSVILLLLDNHMFLWCYHHLLWPQFRHHSSTQNSTYGHWCYTILSFASLATMSRKDNVMFYLSIADTVTLVHTTHITFQPNTSLVSFLKWSTPLSINFVDFQMSSLWII